MKFRRKNIFTLTLAAALLFTGALAGCSNTQTDNSTQSDSSTQTTAQTIKFGIAPGTIRTAVVLLADHLGYYTEENVNVELVEVADATSALTSISTGKNDIDIWGTGIVPDLNFIANGSDLVIFSGTAAEGGAIIAKDGEAEKYKSFDNYKGITIATVRADTAWVVSRAYLKNYGIDVDNEINVIEVDSQVNVAEAVKKGEADLGFLPAEFATKYDDNGVDLVYEVGELEPLYVCCRQVVSRDTLNSKKDELIAFTIANIRALEYYQNENNKNDIVKYLAEYSDQTEEYVEQYLFENRTIMTLDPNKNGVISYYNSLVDAGYFTGSIDISAHIDTEVYETALNTLIEREPENTYYQGLLDNLKNNK